MSANGFNDARLQRGDPGDPHAARLAGAIDASRPVPGAGLTASSGLSGIALSVRRQRPTAARARRHPFEVFISGQTLNSADEVTALKVKIQRGTILQSETWDDSVTIGDLTAELELVPGDLVWIRVDLDEDGVIGDALVESGEAWELYPAAYEFPDGPDGPQTWWQLLAFLRDAEVSEDEDVPDETPDVIFESGEKQVLVQCTTTHLLRAEKCSGGVTKQVITVLMPWAGAVPRLEE